MNERMRQLVDKLNEYAEAYYRFDAPKVSDKEYDALFDELVSLEKETGVVLDDSPTRRVGAEPLNEFAQHRHLGRLWSMDKVIVLPKRRGRVKRTVVPLFNKISLIYLVLSI